MKIKERPNLDEVIFSDGRKPSPVIEVLTKDEKDTNRCMRIRQKHELGLDMEINDLSIMLDELPRDRFNAKRRKEIEAYRRQLIKVQHKEQRENIKLSKLKRKEDERRAKYAKKSVELETATRIAEERQIELLARDRKRRARQRKWYKIKDFICKVVLLILILCGVLIFSNKHIRDRAILTFNNTVDLVQSWKDGDGNSSNKLVEDLIRPFDEEEPTN